MVHKKWFLRPSYLVGLTPAKARDLLVRCFFESEKDVYLQTHRIYGDRLDHVDVRKLANDTVRRAFEQTGHDYHHPTKQALQEVVNVLMKKAAAWNMPPDVIVHNREQLARIISSLP